MELKPITRQGLQYFYDFKKVDGGAYGLQIPLQSLNDEEVNRYYKSFKAFRTFELVALLTPLVYILAAASDGYVAPRDFWTVYFASLGVALALEIPAKHKVNKSIDRYNKLILSPGAGPAGASITIRF